MIPPRHRSATLSIIFRGEKPVGSVSSFVSDGSQPNRIGHFVYHQTRTERRRKNIQKSSGCPEEKDETR